MHDARAVFFAVRISAAAVFGDEDFFALAAEPDADVVDVELVNFGVANCCEDAAEIGVGGEEGGFDERRMADGVADALAFLSR